MISGSESDFSSPGVRSNQFVILIYSVTSHVPILKYISAKRSSVPSELCLKLRYSSDRTRRGNYRTNRSPMINFSVATTVSKAFDKVQIPSRLHLESSQLTVSQSWSNQLRLPASMVSSPTHLSQLVEANRHRAHARRKRRR